jgi:hypothetical protein
MAHIDQLQNIAKRHDNVVPASWLSGDTNYQKAKVIAAVAWHDIKDPADPPFLSCDLTFQENCIGIVESLMRGNMPDDSPFAQQAERRWKEVNTPNTEEIAP